MSDEHVREAMRRAAEEGAIESKRRLLRLRLREAGDEAERLIAYLGIAPEKLCSDVMLAALYNTARSSGFSAEEIMANAVLVLLKDREGLIGELQAAQERQTRIYIRVDEVA